MESPSDLSILYAVILLMRVWGKTVTRKNSDNSDHSFLFKSSKLEKDIFRNLCCPIRKPYFHEKYILEI